MSSGNVSRSYVTHDEVVDNGHHRFSTSAKKATSTPPKRKDFMSPSKFCYILDSPVFVIFIPCHTIVAGYYGFKLDVSVSFRLSVVPQSIRI